MTETNNIHKTNSLAMQCNQLRLCEIHIALWWP